MDWYGTDIINLSLVRASSNAIVATASCHCQKGFKIIPLSTAGSRRHYCRYFGVVADVVVEGGEKFLVADDVVIGFLLKTLQLSPFFDAVVAEVAGEEATVFQ